MEPLLKLTTYSCIHIHIPYHILIKENSEDTKFGVILCILLDHHDLKSEFNNNINYRKPTNSWELNSSQLDHH